MYKIENPLVKNKSNRHIMKNTHATIEMDFNKNSITPYKSLIENGIL